MGSIDQSVLNFFTENRAEWLSSLMLVITYSASYMVIGGMTLLSAASFFIHGHTTRILSLLISVGGSASTVFILKNIISKVRPVTEAFYIESSPSFPSGHAAMAMALYGFIFYTIWRSGKHRLKNALAAFLSVLIILVGLSRLYLGVHYLSDVLAGYAIGFGWILISLSVSRSKIWHLQGNGRLS